MLRAEAFGSPVMHAARGQREGQGEAREGLVDIWVRGQVMRGGKGGSRRAGVGWAAGVNTK